MTMKKFSKLKCHMFFSNKERIVVLNRLFLYSPPTERSLTLLERENPNRIQHSPFGLKWVSV